MANNPKDVVRRWVEEGWNRFDLSAADRCFSESFVGHDPYQMEILGRQGARDFLTAIHGAFSGLEIRIEDMVAEGDRVAARFTVTGTHRATFLGREATGARVAFQALTLWRVEAGQFTDLWQSWDALGLAAQLDGKCPYGFEQLTAFSRHDSTPDDHEAPSDEVQGKNKDTVRAWMDGAWNYGRFELVDDLFSNDFWFYDPGTGTAPTGTKADFRAWASAVDTAFPLPNRSLHIDHLISEADKTAFRVTLRAVHGGEFMNIAPTRQCVYSSAIIIAQHEGGRFKRVWQVFDVMKVLQQIGDVA